MKSGGHESTLLPTVPMTRRSVLALAGSTVVAAALAACSNDSPYAEPSKDPVEPNGIVVDVISIDNTFRPDRIEITPGTEVRWTNKGRTEHDIVPVVGTEWGVAKEAFTPGSTYSHVFGEVGEVPYICTIHASVQHPAFGMKGMIVVVDA